MNELKIFEHEKFGEIRTIEIDGKIYFVGTDVARALGYKNPRDAVYKKVKDHHKKKIEIPHMQNAYGTPHYQNGKVLSQTTIIDESGFYCLVLASKLKCAEDFQEWVTSEVLPSIRKTGTYLENFVDKQKNMWYNITVSRIIDSNSTNS